MKTLTVDSTEILSNTGRIKVPSSTERFELEYNNPINGELLMNVLDTFGWTEEFLKNTDYKGFKVVLEGNNIKIKSGTTELTFPSSKEVYEIEGEYNIQEHNDTVWKTYDLLKGYVFRHSISDINSKVLNLENRYLTRVVNGINEDYEYPLNTVVELFFDGEVKNVVFTTLHSGAQIDDDIIILDRRIISSRFIKQANIYTLNEIIY